MSIFVPSFDVERALLRVREDGFFFQRQAIAPEWVSRLRAESEGLALSPVTSEVEVMQRGRRNEVHQRHIRQYRALGEAEIPEASSACHALAEAVSPFAEGLGLRGWLLNEIGYQRYQPYTDFISPHSDRWSDRLLSVTISLSSYAWMNLYDPLTDPVDYTHLRRFKSVLLGPGSVMLLRAPGFGSGEQVIHGVMPPFAGVRDILNLRMRPTVLPQP